MEMVLLVLMESVKFAISIFVRDVQLIEIHAKCVQAIQNLWMQLIAQKDVNAILTTINLI